MESQFAYEVLSSRMIIFEVYRSQGEGKFIIKTYKMTRATLEVNAGMGAFPINRVSDVDNSADSCCRY